jgi:pimeloyl-ACP methyl ester carboxylesterase
MSKLAKLALGAGVVAGAGVAVGVARHRQLQRRAELGDEVPFGSVQGHVRDVKANDGVRLHVEVDGDDLPGPTLVFSHGYVENLDVWHYPRLALRGRHRMVFYDQRSHGDSGRSPIDHITMTQLARDLRTIINETVPDGPVVVVGHSMGGMTVMEFAALYSEMFGSKVKGVVLVNTSSGRLMVTNPTFNRLSPLVRRGSPFVQWARGAMTRPVLRAILTGPDIRHEHVDMIEKMVTRTSPTAFTHFAPLFTDFDTSEGFPTLGTVPTAIISGTSDRLTPAGHSRYISKQIAGSELTQLDRVGHFAMFEAADRVIDVIETMAEKVAADL